MSSDTIFTPIFHPFSTQLRITFLTHLFFLMFTFAMFSLLMSFMLTNRWQEHDLTGITGHQTTRLLDYWHPETVLLWFLLNSILRWNLFYHHRMLPPLKVPDFLDTEHNTGGEGAWKPTKTSWVHCRLWLKVPATYPPITDWVHSKCSCRFQVEHMMWVHLWNILNVILTCAIHLIPHNS